jgi:hypothetical protein
MTRPMAMVPKPTYSKALAAEFCCPRRPPG